MTNNYALITGGSSGIGYEILKFSSKYHDNILLSYFIKNAEKNISSHTGFVAQISPAFDKDIIDIIPKSKNEELNRWIPVVSKYQRINFEDINENLIDNLF